MKRIRNWACFVLPVILGWIIAPALGLLALAVGVVGTTFSRLFGQRPSAARRLS